MAVTGEKPEADKLTHPLANYKFPSPFQEKYCAGCEHFIRADEPRCTGVKSPINARAWCARYDAEKK